MKCFAEHQRQTGLSLVELMVAMTVGLLLMVGLASVFMTSSQSHSELAKTGAQLENGRYATELLSEDIHHAGFYGEYTNLAPPPGSLSDPCEISNLTTLRTALSLPIQGYNAPSTSPLSCLDDDNFVPGTDILVIRRSATAATAAGSLVTNEVYIQANSDTTDTNNPIVAGGTGTFNLLTVRNTVAADIRKYIVHIYFLSPCSIPTGGGGTVCTSTDDGGSPIPTLKRLELTVDPGTGDRTMLLVPLVEGAEDFQVDYGVDSDADGVPNDPYLVIPATVADWPNVMAVKLHLLIRNTQPTRDFTDDKTYDMGLSGTVTPGGNFKRHSFKSLVRLVNLSSRRETP